MIARWTRTREALAGVVHPWVLPFAAIEGADALATVGGKGANLAWMARAGLPVPDGFCVTTAAFHAFLAGCPELEAHYGALDALDPGDVGGARLVAGAFRDALARVPVPRAIADAVLAAAHRAPPDTAWAVRSSATAEDLPDASFAGQQDTYLNVRGDEPLIDAVRSCWGSLFTDRAVLYRARNHFPHRAVALSVVVQQMVHPDVSGILFTADPVTGSRAVVSIDAGFGLGEALVGGLVDADLYKADKTTGAVRSVKVGDKALAIRGLPEGGTLQEPLSAAMRTARCLDDAQVAALVAFGRQIEIAAGTPQDVEWCLEAGRIYIVQARPITSLYPLPNPPPTDGMLHVYFSFGHVQMMPEAMPPLARDTWVNLAPFGRGSLTGRAEDRAPVSRSLIEAGGRMYIDITAPLRIPRLRKVIFGVLNTVYPHVVEAAESQLARLGPTVEPRATSGLALLPLIGRVPFGVFANVFLRDPTTFGPRVEAHLEMWLARIRAAVRAAPRGEARVRVVRDQLVVAFHALPGFAPTMFTGMFTQKLLRKLGISQQEIEPLLRALPGNVTTEMDLVLADLAELARTIPGLPQRLTAEGLAGIQDHPGAEAFQAGLSTFLQTYGMRGTAEIDISRPRWSDTPGVLVQMILGNLGAEGPTARFRHVQMARIAEDAASALIAKAPWWKRGIIRRLIPMMRYALGVREHGKWFLVRLFAEARAAALDAGAELTARGILSAPADVWFLSWDELVDALHGATTPAPSEITTRREQHARNQRRTPPLVMASDGEIPTFGHREGLPAGALPGLAASAGCVEGIARVVLDPSAELLLPGEILVAPYTDPGWTPLFTHAAGLVTDVGGLMTHGSVIAREMGVPAVVGVTGATTRICTGDRLRVDGSVGYVEILSRAAVPAASSGVAS